MSTIYAVSSGKGKAGVAVIRISGAQAFQVFDVFGIKRPAPRVASFCKLVDGERLIDHALVLMFEGPHSFSGEDTVEIHTHGSIAVMENVLEMLAKVPGFRLAEPGEFSKRAFENNKMDLVQAEGLADLIEAETGAQAKQALRAMEGESSKIYENWRERIIEIMAFVEAYIDFPDENIPADLDRQAQDKIRGVIGEIEEAAGNESGERLRLGAVAAIIGAPNAGKSTLINFLAKRELAIVSEIAGTTRDFLEAHLNIDGYPLTVIDTAGIRETSDSIEKEGVRRALEKAENADFRIVIFEDIDHENFTHEVRKYLDDENSLLVQNKIDVTDVSPTVYGGRPRGGDFTSRDELTIERAKELRKNQTELEQELWQVLRRKNLEGYKFRKQHPVGKYIADFACIEKQLIIEIDGSQHSENQEYDNERTAFLNKAGWNVLRFWNSDINNNIEGVAEVILENLNKATPHLTSPLKMGEASNIQKPPSSSPLKMGEELGREIIRVSLKDKSGTDILLARLKERIAKLLGNSENAVVTRKRHKVNLENCVAELKAFIDARERDLPIELCGENLRRAAFHLGKITGKIGVEDILDKIFSEFCIGK